MGPSPHRRRGRGLRRGRSEHAGPGRARRDPAKAASDGRLIEARRPSGHGARSAATPVTARRPVTPDRRRPPDDVGDRLGGPRVGVDDAPRGAGSSRSCAEVTDDDDARAEAGRDWWPLTVG